MCLPANMKLTTTAPITISRFHKRSSKGSSYKKFLINQKSINGVKREILRDASPCDNSDDSLHGVENNADYLYDSAIPHPSVFKFANSQKRSIDDSFQLNLKRHRVLDGKEHDLEDGYSFPVSHITLPNSNSICVSGGMQNSVPAASKAIRRSAVPTKRSSAPVTLSSQLSATSRNGKVGLQILNQPEQQHRARYQTEGSRGAVKDRTGNSFPVVKITGYNRPTTLQVFIGSDQGRVTPHMFYQACRVTGKNSTPCVEKNIEGTIVIEIDTEPTKDMIVTCDCVGILKERNVDVEHRFPEECSSRSKKKSTRCRMVFRAVITNDDNSTETLQIASQPIACTQPPGIPEICKKSLTHCPVAGGKELFVLGKNFLKDTQVRFYTDDWEQTVTPDKEFLQQTHLVCVVPAYKNLDINEPAAAKVAIVSGNRSSEPHTFTYTPILPIASSPLSCSTSKSPSLSNRLSPTGNVSKIVDSGILKSSDANTTDTSENPDSGLNKITENIKKSNSPTDDCENVKPSVLLWSASNNMSSPTDNRHCTYVLNVSSEMSVPPAQLLHPSTTPLVRRSSIQRIVPLSRLGSASQASSTEILSNISSGAVRSPPGVATHYPDPLTVSHSLATGPVPNYFQATAAYRSALSDVVDPLLLKPVIIPKLEPLSDCSTSSSTNSYSPPGLSSSHLSQLSDIADGSGAIESNNSSLPSSASMAASTQSGAYCSEDRGVENSSAYSSSSIVRSVSYHLSPSSSTGIVEHSNYTNLVNNENGGATYPTTLNAAAALMSPPNNVMPVVNLAETSYNQTASKAVNNESKSFQFNQLFDMKSSQQQQQRTNQENLQTAGAVICYKNAVLSAAGQQSQANSVISGTYQNYYQYGGGSNDSNEGTVNSTACGNVNQSSSSGSNKLSQSHGVDLSLMVASHSSSLLSNFKSSPLMLSGDSDSTTNDLPACSIVDSQQQKHNSSMDGCSFLNSVSTVAAMNEYGRGSGANSMMLDNGSVNSMPKLDALVNDAADSHIRSALGLVGSSSSSSVSQCSSSDRSHSMSSLNMYLSSSTSSLSSSPSKQPHHQQQQQQLQQVNDTVSHANRVQSSDATCSTLTSYQQLMAPTSNQPSAMSNCTKILSTSASSDSLVQMKVNDTDTCDNVSRQIRKSEEGVFPSEISQMTESDLLSYINPSCFDQVG
ncbi:nuclear factor of activated T-cells 5 isoform X3 [Planococcus citri]|uniref:nuclear factor of activated T-cells 5 isoform X3 n=1 Tax=Planococcus citri TaxID=170843 RepID=UPI0031F9AA49